MCETDQRWARGVLHNQHTFAPLQPCFSTRRKYYLYTQAVAGTECFLEITSPIRASQKIFASKCSLVLRKIFHARKKSRLLHIPLNKTIDDGLIRYLKLLSRPIKPWPTVAYKETVSTKILTEFKIKQSQTPTRFSRGRQSPYGIMLIEHTEARSDTWNEMHLLTDGAELVPNAQGEGNKDTQPMYVAEYSLPLDSSEQCSFIVFCGKQHSHSATKAKTCVCEDTK